MKMDTVWQAKVADSAIKTDKYGCGGCSEQLGFGWWVSLAISDIGLLGIGPVNRGQSSSQILTDFDFDISSFPFSPCVASLHFQNSSFYSLIVNFINHLPSSFLQTRENL